jgi:hypothetical protein
VSERLFNTKEAAAYLRVSEASVRRWSDAGLLAVRRIGRRRERRFTEVDLVRFLGAGGQVSVHRAMGMAPEFNVGGLSVPLHGHFATFYDRDTSRLRLALPFLCEGLSAGQTCFLVAAGEVRDAHLEALRNERGSDFDAALQAKQFVVATELGATVEDALEFWEREFWRAIGAGSTVIRVVGEMASERQAFSSEAEMMRYEVSYNLLAKRFQTVTLCQYDVREFDGQMVFHALRAHPDLYSVHIGGFLS